MSLSRTEVFFKKTRLLSRFILSTSWTTESLSPRKRIWSPGAMFHHFIRSAGRTDLILGSNLLMRISHARGKLLRWLKCVVAGFLVVAWRAVFRVRYFKGGDDIFFPISGYCVRISRGVQTRHFTRRQLILIINSKIAGHMMHQSMPHNVSCGILNTKPYSR